MNVRKHLASVFPFGGGFILGGLLTGAAQSLAARPTTPACPTPPVFAHWTAKDLPGGGFGVDVDCPAGYTFQSALPDRTHMTAAEAINSVQQVPCVRPTNVDFSHHPGR